MVETTDTPVLSNSEQDSAPKTAEVLVDRPAPLSVRALLEVGAHFGHQTRRWDPRMKPYLFGSRHGTHIINLDLTIEHFREGLEFLRDTVAGGGKVLFVGTKRQAQATIKLEAIRSGQHYVNNRWLGGMLTNFRTVKKSIDQYKEQLEILGDEERLTELSKKERSRLSRMAAKYEKSLEGIREMTRLPAALFVLDINKEHIAITEANRLGIPVVAIVDSNCNPEGVDFVVPANDDAIRAIQLYCATAADACIEGARLFNERIESEVSEQETGRSKGTDVASAGRRVVEIKQPSRRGRGGGGTHSAGYRMREDRADEFEPGDVESSKASSRKGSSAKLKDPVIPGEQEKGDDSD